jgi:hypothetical protein
VKKLMLVLSVATIGLNAANDWMTDLGNALNDPQVQDAAKKVAKEAQKNAPAIKALSIKYGPAIGEIAQKIANQGETLLAKVPAEHKQALMNQAQNLIGQAAALAQAQAQNNATLVAKAKNLLASHTKELDMIKARAMEVLRNNPSLMANVKEFVDKVKDAAGDSAIATYTNKVENFVAPDLE